MMDAESRFPKGWTTMCGTCGREWKSEFHPCSEVSPSAVVDRLWDALSAAIVRNDAVSALTYAEALKAIGVQTP